ncbi:hypothetical protein [Dehalogenimonas sp. 4OHTPN]|uniref:Uncharacterized protein n=1 Tax=Dehalogenimonas sp. 4OHTPN TaxID=3166643 RepID=A0AAU8G900_9CHLR
MAAGDKSKVTQVLVLLAFVAALAAALYLFFVPAFKGYQGIIFPWSVPPPQITGWQKFAFWPPIPGTTADPFVTFLFVAPVFIASLGLITLWMKEPSARAWVLWGLFFITAITIAPRAFDFGFFFVPVGALLFVAALRETFDSVKQEDRRHAV